MASVLTIQNISGASSTDQAIASSSRSIRPLSPHITPANVADSTLEGRDGILSGFVEVILSGPQGEKKRSTGHQAAAKASEFETLINLGDNEGLFKRALYIIYLLQIQEPEDPLLVVKHLLRALSSTNAEGLLLTTKNMVAEAILCYVDISYLQATENDRKIVERTKADLVQQIDRILKTSENKKPDENLLRFYLDAIKAGLTILPDLDREVQSLLLETLQGIVLGAASQGKNLASLLTTIGKVVEKLRGNTSSKWYIDLWLCRRLAKEVGFKNETLYELTRILSEETDWQLMYGSLLILSDLIEKEPPDDFREKAFNLLASYVNYSRVPLDNSWRIREGALRGLIQLSDSPEVSDRVVVIQKKRKEEEKDSRLLASSNILGAKRKRDNIWDEIKKEPSDVVAPIELFSWAVPSSKNMWHVPKRDPHFVGRNEIINGITEKQLTFPFSDHLLEQVALTGFGGIGKASLACEIAYRQARKYPQGIFWLSGDNLIPDLLQIAEDRGLVQNEMPEAKVVQQVIRWFESHTGWLMILVNVSKPSHYKGLLPRFGGHLLLTTSYQEWDEQLPLPPFTTEEAVEYLIQVTGESNPKAALKLAEDLGRYPLMLSQAAAWIKQNLSTYEDYCHLLAEDPGQALEIKQSTPEQHPPFGKTLSVSLRKLKKKHPNSLPYLRNIAFLASENIPRTVIGCAQESLGQINEVLRPLSLYCFIHRGEREGTVSTHRIFQQTVIKELSKEERQQAVENLLDRIEGLFEFNEYAPATWEKSKWLLPHLTRLLDLSAEDDQKKVRRADILRKMGSYYLFADRNPEKAERFFQQAKSIYDAFEDQLVKVIDTLNRLGHSLLDQNKWEDASKSYENAFVLNQKSHTDRNLKAASLIGLGNALQQQGRNQEAVEYFSEALRVLQSKWRKQPHQDEAACYNNLAVAYEAMGDYDRSLECHLAALEIRKKIFPKAHPERASSYHNLGNLYTVKKDYDNASHCHLKALGILKSTYGKDSLRLLGSLSNLAMIRLTQKDYGKAIAYLKEVQRIQEERFGKTNEELAETLKNLSTVYLQQGDRENSRELLEQVYGIFLIVHGRRHQETIKIRQTLRSFERSTCVIS